MRICDVDYGFFFRGFLVDKFSESFLCSGCYVRCWGDDDEEDSVFVF